MIRFHAHSLTDLPYDVVQIIAKFLLPYDILALSKTCKSFQPILYERSVWLKVADMVSRSRPLPYTAAQALDLPVKEVILACLRAERVATRWSNPHIIPRVPPVKICFPDKRFITYFTFLPGSRHLMVYDVCNVLSCWSTEGQLLQSWDVARGAKLTRWKPCDESENSYDYERGMLAVEIMIEYPSTLRRSRPTHCELILLTYSNTQARFTHINSFRVPSVYEPFSAMTQDELRGSLVGIPSLGEERVGIYLTDRNTDKAVCIDTGLNLVLDCVPQALLSPKHMCLYWETTTSAHTVSYDMDLFREVLAREGRSQDDPKLNLPVAVQPSDKRVIPFETVRALAEDVPDSMRASSSRQASVDLGGNWDAYPVIIPKWTTLYEDQRRHRTRSVLSFLRRPPGEDTAPIQPVFIDLVAAGPPNEQAVATVNAAHHHGNEEQADANAANHNPANQGQQLPQGQSNPAHAEPEDLEEEMGPLPVPGPAFPGGEGDAFNNAQYEQLVQQLALPAIPHVHPNPDPVQQIAQHVHHHIHHHHHHPHHLHEPPPRTTITHHYFDYISHTDELGGTAQVPVLRRMVIAEAMLRRPRDVHVVMHRNVHLPADGAQANVVGDAGAAANANANVAANGNGNANGLAVAHGGVGEGQQVHQVEAGNVQINVAGAPGALGVLAQDMAQFANAMANLQLVMGNAANAELGGAEIPIHIDFGDDLVQDPFGGSPVMGYGGRCAMWVEEHVVKDLGRSLLRMQRSTVKSLMRIATFPTYHPPGETALVHKELEAGGGRVATLHLPEYISLENAYTFDLDDVRGVVGIATAYGEIWLIDGS